jgi:hypothetical protein
MNRCQAYTQDGFLVLMNLMSLPTRNLQCPRFNPARQQRRVTDDDDDDEEDEDEEQVPHRRIA